MDTKKRKQPRLVFAFRFLNEASQQQVVTDISASEYYPEKVFKGFGLPVGHYMPARILEGGNIEFLPLLQCDPLFCSKTPVRVTQSAGTEI
jgi:hypothetical protein